MVYSAGIIPFRRNSNGELEFFVGHPGGVGNEWTNYWAYLKGGVEEGETWIDCAWREFCEESGLTLSDVSKTDLIPLGTSKQNKRKIVVAFGLYYPNIEPSECFSNMADNGLNPEIDRYAWFTFDELKNRTHPMHLNFYEQIIEMTS